VRPSVVRASVVRPSVVRPSVCDSHGHCIQAVAVPSVAVPSVAVAAVGVPPAVLDAKVMPEIKSPCIHVFANRSTTVYQVCTDVLFAFNRANIRPAAAAVLRQLAHSLAQRFPGAHLEVDGNTDSIGTPTYNQGLSVRRAQAVASWLTHNAGVAPSRMTVRGFGETAPVASNATAAGRALNRRVAIGVTPG
jgi:outer membrane protein OmpA-like peptidoglycan-associated protein